ncbi:hypothetical protein KCU78_g21752, partial [Aureobasidium melanogenum]
TEIVVKALGADWHAKCFCCTECGDGFDDGRYFLRGNNQDPTQHSQLSVIERTRATFRRSGASEDETRRLLLQPAFPPPPLKAPIAAAGLRHRERRSPSPKAFAIAPQLVFETPSAGSTRSVREEVLSTTDAPSVYYTASWGSPYTRPTQDPSVPSAEGTPIASQRHTTSESPSPSISFGLEHLLPSRVAVQGRDFSPSFGLDHLLPSRIPIQHHIASPVTTERLALQEDSAQAVAQRPSRHTITRRLTEDWVQQYTTGKWRSERG